jgi:signal transduction histidine kinase
MAQANDAAEAEKEIVALQREANEQLLLALLREVDRADRAEHETADLRANAAELRDIARFRERLIAIVGHDLRNPLNAILMAAGMLVTGGRLIGRDAELAGRILDSSRRMKRIIVQVLEFTRARLGGGFALDRGPCDLGDIARRIIAELALASRLPIELRVAGNVAGTWDGDLLGEALSNVVGNAVEHAHAASKVIVDVRESEDGVSADVMNEGMPIPANLLEQIFEPFRKGEPEGRPAGNLGLGLYVAREIVSAHGGHITVRTGTRTTFTIALPKG